MYLQNMQEMKKKPIKKLKITKKNHTENQTVRLEGGHVGLCFVVVIGGRGRVKSCRRGHDGRLRGHGEQVGGVC